MLPIVTEGMKQSTLASVLQSISDTKDGDPIPWEVRAVQTIRQNNPAIADVLVNMSKEDAMHLFFAGSRFAQVQAMRQSLIIYMLLHGQDEADQMDKDFGILPDKETNNDI